MNEPTNRIQTVWTPTMAHTVSRFLLHPEQDVVLFRKVLNILDDAVAEYPDAFDKAVDQPSIVDNYGYRTRTLGATVLAQESFSSYYRLTIRKDEHEVFDRLAALILEEWADLLDDTDN